MGRGGFQLAAQNLEQNSRGILLVSLFVTLTNHSLTIYYNLIYSLSASWPAAEEMRDKEGGWHT